MARLPDVDFDSDERRDAAGALLLYQLAYAEFYQTDTLWPDFTVMPMMKRRWRMRKEIAGLAAYKLG